MTATRKAVCSVFTSSTSWSATAPRLILDECIARGSNLHDLPDYAVIQINDTHPTMVIPELIRLLMIKGITFHEAMDIVSRTCAYTNHTILAEALEKWPMKYLEKVVPQLTPIIYALDDMVRRNYSDESVYIIDKNNLYTWLTLISITASASTA